GGVPASLTVLAAITSTVAPPASLWGVEGVEGPPNRDHPKFPDRPRAADGRRPCEHSRGLHLGVDHRRDLNTAASTDGPVGSRGEAGSARPDVRVPIRSWRVLTRTPTVFAAEWKEMFDGFLR